MPKVMGMLNRAQGWNTNLTFISPLHREPNVRVSTGRAGLHAEERACDARGASQTLGDGREKTGDVVQLGRHSNRILGLDGWPMPST